MPQCHGKLALRALALLPSFQKVYRVKVGDSGAFRFANRIEQSRCQSVAEHVVKLYGIYGMPAVFPQTLFRVVERAHIVVRQSCHLPGYVDGLLALHALFGHVHERRNEYGCDAYYLFSSLVLDRHIVEQILPTAIVSSNYKDWQDTDKLLSQISLQDYQIILWALICLMYPTGAPVSYICGNKDCGHIHTERVDLGKLRLNNTALINEAMIKHFSSKSVDDKALEEYRKNCNLEEVITFEVSDSPDSVKRFKITLRQANLKDYLDVGRAYNAELTKQIDANNREAVLRYITYNQNRCYRPWIKSVECTAIIDGEEIFSPIIENDTTGNNDKTIDLILDEIQQNNVKFNKQIQDYIQKTKISHIAFFIDKCPKCGEKPVTSYEGYIPYDMSQAFFTLGRMKLLRISYLQNEQKDSNDTSKNTSAS